MTKRHLVLAAQWRPCVKCKAPTFWATNAQLSHGKYGLCLDDAWGVPGLDAPDDATALANILHVMGPGTERIPDVLNPDDVNAPWRIRWHWVKAAVVWTVSVVIPGHRVGPCVRCRRPIRRYGPAGSALCPDCRKRRDLTLKENAHDYRPGHHVDTAPAAVLGPAGADDRDAPGTGPA